jgi:hypothetical protein
MRAGGIGLRSVVPCIAVGLLASCGGGGYGGGMGGGGMGGGYGGGGGNQMMPTVQFTSPAQPISLKLGQGVQLAWTSTNATTCSATASSVIGGAFTGNEPTSGHATVAPTGTGMVTYMLTCTGPGGMGKAMSPMVTVNPSILSSLSATKITTIGKTVDPIEGGGNPYGLVIAPATAGLITKGDLVVCNFNDGATNTQGLGTTIVGLHPTPGSMPYRIAQSASLKGCDALTMLPDDSISAAAFASNQNPLVSPTGMVTSPFGSDSRAGPWGEAYAAAANGHAAAIYVSNADGSIDRITLNGDAQSMFTRIASGFCAGGQPGAIFAPAGLTYDPSIDTLYVVDTSSNSVVAFANVSGVAADAVTVSGQCKSVAAPPTPVPTFSGPSAGSVRVIAHGGSLIAPLSAALLADGDLLVANADINIAAGQTPNLVTEISPVLPGGFVGQPVQLDSGAAGALFGIAATTDGQGNQIVFFNDDNPPYTVMMLTK